MVDMEKLTSIHEMRRRAPLHYWVKAANARFAAYTLSILDPDTQKRRAEQIGYYDGTSVALGEAFLREASLSLELAIKTLIAHRIELRLAMDHVTRVKLTHDL